jgi:Uncharacterised nucleotidyltransferase
MTGAHGVDRVAEVLRSPARVAGLSPASWDLLVRQARRADLLGRIALLLRREGLIDQVPAAPRAHLDAAVVLTAAQHLEVQRELAAIGRCLAPLGLQPVLLKGAAYLMSDGAAALGRTFDDVDLLVPKARLPEVEAQLMMGGWVSTHLNAYDQRYYREWMHELPPMQHAARQSVLDVHHAILPETAHVRPDSALLLHDARPVAGHPGWHVLSPPDMLLHSMTHLFHNEELSHGLRDLSDLDLMLRHEGRDDGFWDRLQARAEALSLTRTLHHGLQQTHRILGTPVPPAALQRAARHAAARPLDAVMQRLWAAALRTPHSSARQALTPPANLLLFLRAHALRMPPTLLLRHLAVKAWRRHVLREQGA